MQKCAPVERMTTLVRRIAKEMPGRSVRDLVIRTGVKKTTVHKILRKTLNFKPWKPIRCHELKDNDYQKCYDFGETMLELRRQDPRFFSNIVWSDEASFHINGCVTLRNCYFLAPKNPNVLYKKAVGKQRVTVWCGMTADRLIGPFIMRDTMNAERYLDMLVNDVCPILRHRPQLRLMSDGAPAHFERNVRQWMDRHFNNRWIGRGGPIARPARSPDLTPCDFFLWGWVKNKVYQTMPGNIEELAETIRNVMTNIPQQFLANAVAAVPRRLEQLLSNGGGYVEF